MKRKKIALLAGGYSGEYQVSLASANNIAEKLVKDYDVFTVMIEPERWYCRIKDQDVPVDKNDFSLNFGNIRITFDAVFITIHGTPGEDGKLQGYFDLLGIPYNTCDATTSAITMNKAYTKTLVQNIPDLFTARSVHIFKQSQEAFMNLTHLNYPLFVKANNGGSSVGMSKVHDTFQLPAALKKAFAEDCQVLVEEFISGREFSVGAVDLRGELLVLPVTEIVTSKEFFDFEAKYKTGLTKEITPAVLSKQQLERVTRITRQIYRQLNCRGMVRVDFILQERTGRYYFIEVNTTPGQSATSLIPQQVSAAGMDISAFYGGLIENACDKA